MGNPFEDTGYRGTHRSERGGAALGDAASGAPPSNRAPDSCTELEFQLLSHHVDSLELSYKGTPKPHIVTKLESLKEQAQSRDEQKQAGAQILIGEDVFSVRDRGAPRFPFVIENGLFYIKLGVRGASSPLPFAYAQIRNQFLVQSSPVVAEAMLRGVLEIIADDVEAAIVSRIDLAADFATNVALESWDRDAWVTRIRHVASFSDGNKFTGWKIGTHKNPISLRLYDKTHEIQQQSGKTFFHEIWTGNGWAPWDDVLRVEGEFRRESLAKFGLSSLPDVLSNLNALWKHLTGEVVRLTAPSASNEQRARWPMNSLWARISAIVWGEPRGGLEQLTRPTNAPSKEMRARAFGAVLTSHMAAESILDVSQAVETLQDLLHAELAKKSFLDESPRELLITRARVKGRKFFTLRNVEADASVPPSQESAAARAYRRASDGG